MVESTCDDRSAAALALLATLAATGTVHAPLAVKPTAYGGIGVFAAAPIPAGATVLSLPSASMLVTGASQQAMLPLMLARERRNASSETMQRYVATLPSTCPDNLVGRPAADHALVSASLHGWKVDSLQREQRALRDDAAASDWGVEEEAWALCMKLSRAFASVAPTRAFTSAGGGPVMMPFVDLFDHSTEPSCNERGRWVDEAAGRWVAEVTALRELAAGDEVTFSYVEITVDLVSRRGGLVDGGHFSLNS
jgi:hypothetical protein